MTAPLLNGKYKVADLDGAMLDAAVAKAEGRRFKFDRIHAPDAKPFCLIAGAHEEEPEQVYWLTWVPSKRWDQGGPIIEREEITTFPGGKFDPGWVAGFGIEGGRYMHEARTLLIAAMRAFVASKLGGEVDL